MSRTLEQLKRDWEYIRQKTGRKPVPIKSNEEIWAKKTQKEALPQKVRVEGKIYNGLKEASRRTGIPRSTITGRIKRENNPDYCYVYPTQRSH